MDKDKERDELLNKAMRLCSGREYCISDVESLLDRWGAREAGMKGWIINKLVSEKFIDEYRYSRAYALDHFRHSRWGKVKITMGLKGKKVDPLAIASALEAIDDGEYLALLNKTLDDLRRKTRSANRADLKGRLLRHALGRGFESHLVYDAINSLFRE